MPYSNELKVGAALLLAALAAFLGIRFFQDLPLFGGSYPMYAEFEDAGGLVPGNPVQMKGVKIGSVDDVALDPKTQMVRVRFQLNEEVEIPEESYAKVSGFSGLSGVRISIVPGPGDNDPLPHGSTLKGPPEGTVLDRLTDRAPALAAQVDTLLTTTNATMGTFGQQLQDPSSDLRKTLASLRQISGDLGEVTTAEKESIRQLLQNLQAISSNLRTFTGENGDSLDLAVQRLNQSLERLNRSLASFEQTSATLDTLTTKLNEGDGTAGRLVNDPGLYTKLDSAAARTNRILLDFQKNPNRYLEDMTLVKVF